MRKKFWIILAALLVIALGAAALILSGYTYVGGQFLKKGENTYDLREKSLSLADYEAICNAFPEANIYWRVRFQGNPIPEDTTDLTVTSLTDEDIRVLAYLPELKVLHAEGCTDYDALMQVIQDYPELKVFYTVVLGNTAVGSGDERLSVNSWGSIKNIKNASRGKQLWLAALCRGKQDSFALSFEIWNTVRNALQDFSFIVTAFSETVRPRNIHGIQYLLKPVMVGGSASREFRELHNLYRLDPHRKSLATFLGGSRVHSSKELIFDTVGISKARSYLKHKSKLVHLFIGKLIRFFH